MTASVFYYDNIDMDELQALIDNGTESMSRVLKRDIKASLFPQSGQYFYPGLDVFLDGRKVGWTNINLDGWRDFDPDVDIKRLTTKKLPDELTDEEKLSLTKFFMQIVWYMIERLMADK